MLKLRASRAGVAIFAKNQKVGISTIGICNNDFKLVALFVDELNTILNIQSTIDHSV